jgi:hypothetical protein
MTLLCTFVLTAFGGTGARAGNKADVEKELKKFQGTWTDMLSVSNTWPFRDATSRPHSIPSREYRWNTFKWSLRDRVNLESFV